MDATVTVEGTEVRGVAVGPETRCAHYASDRDVVAIRFSCCDAYYSCLRCHDDVADHPRERRPRERFDEPAVLCGVCGTELTVTDYLSSGDRCPVCGAAFNPGCRAHHHLYFEIERRDSPD